MTEICIPFSGFYNRWHDDALDQALEQAFHDDHGTIADTEAYEAAWERVNWRKVRELYAAHYASVLADECAMPGLTFNRLDSPREYNFRTDEIICDIPAETLADIYRRCDKVALAALVAERLAPCSGFIPFYSDDLAEWGDFDTWESAQISVMIESWCNESEDSEWRDMYAMEGASGNGYYDQWLDEAGAFNTEGN